MTVLALLRDRFIAGFTVGAIKEPARAALGSPRVRFADAVVCQQAACGSRHGEAASPGDLE